MGALLFFIALNAPNDVNHPDAGTMHAISRYGAIEGKLHGALELCTRHAHVLNDSKDGFAYFCKELPDSVTRKLAPIFTPPEK